MRCPSQETLAKVLQDGNPYHRVRLSIKDNECVAMFYKETPLHFCRYLFAESESGGPLVYLMEDSFMEEDATILDCQPKHKTPLHAACAVTLLLTSDSVRTFELEFAERDENKQLELVKEIRRLIGTIGGNENRICIERLVLNPKIHRSVIPLLKALIFKFKGNAIVDIEEPSIAPNEVLSMAAYQRILEHAENGDIVRTINYSMECHGLRELVKFSSEHEGPVTIRFRMNTDDFFEASKDELEQVNEKVVMQRIPYPEWNRIVRFCKSECAVWIHCVTPEDEEKYEEFYKNEKCGGYNMCQKCSNPFDFRYYLFFYHRLVHEPEWMRAMCIPDDKEKAAKFDKDMEGVNEMYMEYLKITGGEYAKKTLRQLKWRKMESEKAARQKAQKKNEKNRRKRENKKNRTTQEKKDSKNLSSMQETEKSLALVRLSISENKCMFVIYKNIEEVSTQTFLETPEGVIVTHVDNIREERTFTFAKMALLDVVCRSLKTALSGSRIENFEFEFPGFDEEKQQVELVKEIEKCLRKSKGSQNVFRAKRLVVSDNITEAIELIVETLFDLKELQELSLRSVIIKNDSLIPTVAYEYTIGRFSKNTLINTDEKPNLEKLKFMASQDELLSTMRGADGSTKLFDEQVVSSVRVNEHVEMKRIVDEDRKLVLRFNKSACGMWIHCVQLKCEWKFQRYFENETCGLHHFCQKCSTPFDYWYLQNMPRFLDDRPNWCKGVSSSEENAFKNPENSEKNSEEEKARKKEEQEKRRHWSGMRVEDKQEVIKRLDLMSRHAMRCVSRADREVVDSTDHYVPRVRLSLKDDNAVVTIYTGIEKFLRVEIKRGYGGVLVYRMENTYNRKKACVKLIRSAVLPTAMSILQTLFVHKSVLLGTLEIETVERSVRRQYYIFAMMLRCLQTHWHPENVFRAKRFTVNYVIGDRLRDYMVKELLDGTVLKEVDTECLTLDAAGNTSIQEMRSLQDVNEHGVKTNINEYMTIKQEGAYEVPTERQGEATNVFTIRWSDDSAEANILSPFENMGLLRLNEQVGMRRYLNKETGVVARLNTSLKCGGLWLHHLPEDQEQRFEEMFKNETCGLRHLCKTCSDPFDYWFYSNLAWRVYYEPDHFDIQYVDGPYHDVKFINEDLKKHIRELFKIELQKQKSNGEVVKKSGVGESWGFTKMIDKDVDTEVSDVMSLSDMSSSDDEEDSNEESY